jgi:hypothetical protein
MNERIKELLNQAGIYQPDRFDAIDGSNQMEKFAELIVRECAYIARQCYTVRAVEAEDVAKHIEETFRS